VNLICIAKAECATILSAKQAAFIQNPDYHFEGSGPDIVTVGHNPYLPNLGLSHHVVLPCDNRGIFVNEILYEYLADKGKPSELIRPLLAQAITSYKEAGESTVPLYGSHFASQLLIDMRSQHETSKSSPLPTLHRITLISSM